MNINQILSRAKDILLKPKETWPAIEAEQATASSLYKDYLIYLAAIPAVCGFIGMSIIGIGGFGFSIRIPILSGLITMIVQYVMSLVMVYVFSLVINALAPTFGGQKNPLSALKLAVYASTASMIGGLFSLLPTLGLLGVLCGLYGIYLIYIGLPVLMKNPPERSVVYTIVILLVSIVIGMVMAAITALVTPNPYKLGSAGSGNAVMSLKTPGGEVKIDAAKVDAASKRMEEAQKQMEAAQKSGDTAAMAKATGDAMAAATGMLGGDANVLPIPTDALKNFLPPQLGPFRRTAFDVNATSAGFTASVGKADYEANNQRLHLTITDAGGLSGLVRFGGAMVSGERETATSVEKTWQEGGRTLHHRYQKDGSHAEFRVILKNGVMVEANGNRVMPDMLKSLAMMIDLNGLENYPRPKKS